VEKLDDETKQLIDEVAAMAAKVGGGNLLESRPEYREHLEVLAIYDRCRSTFGAVRLLAMHGFGQEAVPLGRSLFTESLMLMELAEANKRRRAELVIGWSLATADDLEGVFREAAAGGEDPADELKAVAKLRADLKEFARELNVRTRRWRPDEKSLAHKHKRDGHLDFRVAHHFVHGSTLASSQRYLKVGDVTFIVPRGGWALPSVLFAAQSLLYAVRAVSTILEFPEPAELDELLQRIEATE